MNDISHLRSIIEQYSKHGWTLRRANVTPATRAAWASEPDAIEPEVLINESENEALWFSRRSHPDHEAWELRRLSGSPFALVAVLEDSLTDEDREAVLEATEKRMFDGLHPSPTFH